MLALIRSDHFFFSLFRACRTNPSRAGGRPGRGPRPTRYAPAGFSPCRPGMAPGSGPASPAAQAPSVPVRLPAPPELEQIMRPAEQFPLARSPVLPSQEEPAAAARVFDLPEDGFHRPRTLLAGRPAALRHELPLHLLADGDVLRDPPPRRRRLARRSGSFERIVPFLARGLPLLPVLPGRDEKLGPVRTRLVFLLNV